jgi:uncharacterized protein YcfJ
MKRRRRAKSNPTDKQLLTTGAGVVIGATLGALLSLPLASAVGAVVGGFVGYGAGR